LFEFRYSLAHRGETEVGVQNRNKKEELLIYNYDLVPSTRTQPSALEELLYS